MVGDLLVKYVDSDGNRCFTDEECKYFNNRDYSENRELFKNVIGVHTRLNEIVKNKGNDAMLTGGEFDIKSS